MNIKHTAGIDVEVGNTLIEVKPGLRAVRNLRTGLMDLAYRLVQRTAQHRALLVLTDPEITQDRLEREWRAAQETLRPEVMERLNLVVFKDGQFHGLPQDSDPKIRPHLERIVLEQLERGGSPLARGETYYELLEILIHQWLLDKGPMTADWLAKTAGCNYRTVASALRRLGGAIKRHSDRRIELAYFPQEEFARLLAVSDRFRATTRFTDRSGQPRSPEAHLRRLEKLNVTDIAIGGVIGARHYDADLDLVGTPRLDLSLHCPGKQMNLSFIEKLDPALKRVDDPHQPANVVIHAVRHANPLFQPRDGGLRWADPVECLIDLHEGHLDAQAADFLRALEARQSQMS
jgi:hypothetical protein